MSSHFICFHFSIFSKKSLECSYVLEPLSFKFIPKYAAFVIDIGGWVCARIYMCMCMKERERKSGGREGGREREGEIWCFNYPAVKSEFIIIDYLVEETSLLYYVRLQSLELDSESGSHKGTHQVTWHTRMPVSYPALLQEGHRGTLFKGSVP